MTEEMIRALADRTVQRCGTRDPFRISTEEGITVLPRSDFKRQKGAFGVVAGVLCDIAIGSPPIGFTILLTLLGLGVGWLSDRLMGRNFLTLVLLSFGSLLVCGFFQTFTLWAFEGVPLGPLLKTVFLQTLYSLFFTVPLAGVVRHSAYRGG